MALQDIRRVVGSATITELLSRRWEVVFTKRVVLPLSGDIASRDEIREFDTAVEAQRFVAAEDKATADALQEAGVQAVVVSTITWVPYSRIGRMVVNAIT